MNSFAQVLGEAISQEVANNKNSNQLPDPKPSLCDPEIALPLLKDAFAAHSPVRFAPGDVVRLSSPDAPYKYPRHGELAIVLASVERNDIGDSGELMHSFDDIRIVTKMHPIDKPEKWYPASADSTYFELVKPASEVFPDGLPNLPSHQQAEA